MEDREAIEAVTKWFPEKVVRKKCIIARVRCKRCAKGRITRAAVANTWNTVEIQLVESSWPNRGILYGSLGPYDLFLCLLSREKWGVTSLSILHNPPICILELNAGLTH